MKKNFLLIVLLLFGADALLTSCVAVQIKPTEANFKAPVVRLESFEVQQFDGYWYFSKEVKPSKGSTGHRGAPLLMSFIFAIENPNPYPVLLEGINFAVAFDKDFDLVTVSNQDAFWIPADKTNEVRATTMINVRSALLCLQVTGGSGLESRGWSEWQALERWWTGVPDYAVPVTVHDGVFTFKADGVVKVLPFEATVE
jgi:hypothetical protein